MGKPPGENRPAVSSASDAWKPSLDTSMTTARRSKDDWSDKAIGEEESAAKIVKYGKWSAKKAQSESSDWMKSAPVPPPETPPKPTCPWMRCTLCGKDGHTATNCPEIMKLHGLTEKMQADVENEVEGTATSSAATTVEGKAADPTGEPSGDLPAGNVAGHSQDRKSVV